MDGSRHTTQTIRAGRRQLTARWRRDRDIDTCWTLEHPLKDTDDLRAWLELPQAEFGGRPDPTGVLDAEKRLGNAGIVGLDTPDPLCCVAPLFEMGQYTIIAMTEQKLFHRALERAAALLLPRVEAIAAALPGRLWRIYGPEYASPPYLPPRLFREYVTAYVTPMVDVIQRHGGYARLHSHGRLRDILDDIAATGCCGLDPIEPPPQGDVSLADVRERYGEQLVLFGNLEISDIENLPTAQLEPRVITALREGTAGRGRGFVLMPSASPYGRQLAPLTVSNYTRIVALAEAFTG